MEFSDREPSWILRYWRIFVCRYTLYSTIQIIFFDKKGWNKIRGRVENFQKFIIGVGTIVRYTRVGLLLDYILLFLLTFAIYYGDQSTEIECLAEISSLESRERFLYFGWYKFWVE